MVFATSGVETAFWVPPLVALVVSTFTSIGGLSGAFLLLPFQMSFLGYFHPSVSATNQFFNIVAIPSGVYRYWREGRMVWPLTLAVIVGTMPGVMVGAFVRVTWLPDPKSFKLFAGLLLLYIGLRLLRDLLGKGKAGGGKGDAEKRFNELVREHRRKAEEQGLSGEKLPGVRVIRFDRKRIDHRAPGHDIDQGQAPDSPHDQGQAQAQVPRLLRGGRPAGLPRLCRAGRGGGLQFPGIRRGCHAEGPLVHRRQARTEGL